MAATGYPRSSLLPDAALLPTAGPPGTPSSARYPSATRYPTEGPALPQIIQGGTVDSAERLGGPARYTGFLPSDTSFPSGVGIGRLRITAGSVSIKPTGISTAATFGAVQLNLTVAPTAVGGGFLSGVATVLRGSVSVSPAALSSGAQFGEQYVRRASDRYVVALGIPSGEAFGTLSSIGVGVSAVNPASIGGGFLSGLAAIVSYAYVSAPPVGPVGHPRRGLRPGVGKQPGHLHVGSTEDSPYLYARIKYPSGTIFPGPGLYPDRTDFSPVHRRGTATASFRSVFSLTRTSHLRQFLAGFVSSGVFSVHGIFSRGVASGPSDIVTSVLEYSDGVYQVEMGDGHVVADFEHINVVLDSE